MRDWNGHCHRCKAKTLTHTMSRCNMDLICDACEEAEKTHPGYAAAAAAELAATKAGDYNFPGVGWPPPAEPKVRLSLKHLDPGSSCPCSE